MDRWCDLRHGRKFVNLQNVEISICGNYQPGKTFFLKKSRYKSQKNNVSKFLEENLKFRFFFLKIFQDVVPIVEIVVEFMAKEI